MAKQDVLDAINATIVPNNLKGISADSLRNILTMIVENAGEGGSGSGDGALKVMVPDTMMTLDLFREYGEFSLSTWEEVKLYGVSIGLDLSPLDSTVTAAFEYNAQIYQTFIDKAKAGEGILCMIDGSLMAKAGIELQLATDPLISVLVEEMATSCGQLAQVGVTYLKAFPDSGMQSNTMIEITPIGVPDNIENGFIYYQSDMKLYLNEDGSIVFQQLTTEPES